MQIDFGKTAKDYGAYRDGLPRALGSAAIAPPARVGYHRRAKDGVRVLNKLHKRHISNL